MTNAPEFSWHLTNLNNFTFLDNIDRSRAVFGAYEAIQPGSGIAKAGLPETDTSVDRFVRAVSFAQFAEKQADPDEAVRMVAHLMNNFDRPKGITIDPPDQGSAHLQVQGQQAPKTPTEFTSCDQHIRSGSQTYLFTWGRRYELCLSRDEIIGRHNNISLHTNDPAVPGNSRRNGEARDLMEPSSHSHRINVGIPVFDWYRRVKLEQNAIWIIDQSCRTP